jgi:long-chain fatty acid transport protein
MRIRLDRRRRGAQTLPTRTAGAACAARGRWRPAAAGALVLALFRAAAAGGFALMEQGGRELGEAFAGATTNTEDASSVFFNPAAMTALGARWLTLAGHLVVPSQRFNDAGSRLPGFAGGATLSGGGGDAAQTVFIPNVYYAQEVTPDLVFGIGLNAPFGLSTDYNRDWKGRYHSLDSELDTINLSPALGARINRQLSLGAGVNVQYMRARLSNAIDFGTLCVGSLGIAPCDELGLAPQGADGHFKVEGDAVSWGWNLGALYSWSPNTRLGIAYRSKIDQTLRGDADFSVPAAALPLTRGGTVFVDTDAKAEVHLPDSLALGVYHRFGPRWAVAADVLWTRWSRFKELRIRFDSAQPDLVSQQDWNDAWRYAVGVNYLWSPSWTLRGGVAYDQTPVPDPQLRSPRAPDSDRVWLTFGASHRFTNHATVHLAYAHLFINDPHIDTLSPTGDRLVGRYEAHTDIVSLQMDWSF